jgi:hypothetical protein
MRNLDQSRFGKRGAMMFKDAPPNAGHFFPEEVSEQTAEALNRFLGAI